MLLQIVTGRILEELRRVAGDLPAAGLYAGPREFALAVRGRNVLVAGDAKSGKSRVAGLLCEQLILQGLSVCVIDPEGDSRALEGLPGVPVLGGEDPPPSPNELLRALRYPDRSLVIDLSRLPQDAKIEYTRAVCRSSTRFGTTPGFPTVSFSTRPITSCTMSTRRGCSISTPTGHRRHLLGVTSAAGVAGGDRGHDRDAGVEYGGGRRVTTMMRDVRRRRAGAVALLAHLRTSQAVALPITEEAGGDLRLFTLGPRLTPHVRHREKYVDVPVSETRAFVFGAHGRRTRTLREFIDEVEHATDLDDYLGRNNFSCRIRDVFGDHALAAELRAIEIGTRRFPRARRVRRSRHRFAPATIWRACRSGGRRSFPQTLRKLPHDIAANPSILPAHRARLAAHALLEHDGDGDAATPGAARSARRDTNEGQP